MGKNLNNKPRELLRELLEKYGSSIVADPRRCEGFIRDYCSEYELETNVLISALKEHIPEDLLNSQDGLPFQILVNRLQTKLQDKLGLSEEPAKWAVETWALGLGVSQSEQSGLFKDFHVDIQLDDGNLVIHGVGKEKIAKLVKTVMVGQKFYVKVTRINRQINQISLYIKNMSLINSGNWEHRIKSILEGQLIEGTVTRLTKYGAFVSLKDGLEGFIHVSEIAENRIEHPKELLHEGDVLTLRIIKINSEQHRIGLSIRQVDSSKYADLDWKYLEEVLGELETQDTNEENENEEKRMYLEKNSIWRKKGEADDNDEDSYFDYYGDELEDDSGDYND